MNKLTCVNCVIVGDNGLGKNFLMITETTRKGSLISPDMNSDCYKSTLRFKGQCYNLTLYEKPTGFGKSRNTQRKMVYAQAHIFFVCFSVNDESTFENASAKWIPEIRQSCPTTPIVLIGFHEMESPSTPMSPKEKVRFVFDKLDAERYITFDQCIGLASNIKAKAYLECNALKKTALRNVFEEAVFVTLGAMKVKPSFKFGCFSF